jgi:hypothetical protein
MLAAGMPWKTLNVSSCLPLFAAKPLADSIKDDPDTGKYNVHEAVEMFVQKAKEWQSCVRGEKRY